MPQMRLLYRCRGYLFLRKGLKTALFRKGWGRFALILKPLAGSFRPLSKG